MGMEKKKSKALEESVKVTATSKKRRRIWEVWSLAVF